jgi:hypothetical protein
MSINDYAALVVAICTVIGFFITAIRWMVKHYLQELKPNGGSSIKDKVDNLSLRVDRIEDKLDTLINSIINRVA